MASKKKTTKKAASKRRSKAAGKKAPTKKRAPTKAKPEEVSGAGYTRGGMEHLAASIPGAIYFNDPAPAKDPTPPGEIIVKEPLEKRMAAIQAIAESNRDLAKALTTVAASVSVSGCVFNAAGDGTALSIDQGAPGGE